ncbi:hypothetical protein [Acidisphaera rubrifaciens]|uniref:hypothetical protein n=1 Tax=Acidisphaera rubrifaciens TaxID=50715 RepID=UPI00130DAD00|nr:hypothetical protein [Acidisphaera rubrifaciens]
MHDIGDGHDLDPDSLAYLYVVQQRRRLILAEQLARLRQSGLVALPYRTAVVLVRAVDLWIANQIIASLINEHALLAACGEQAAGTV